RGARRSLRRLQPIERAHEPRLARNRRHRRGPKTHRRRGATLVTERVPFSELLELPCPNSARSLRRRLPARLPASVGDLASARALALVADRELACRSIGAPRALRTRPGGSRRR